MEVLSQMLNDAQRIREEESEKRAFMQNEDDDEDDDEGEGVDGQVDLLVVRMFEKEKRSCLCTTHTVFMEPFKLA